MSGDDRTRPRDCHHPRARHTHGTLAAWRADGCRCPDCDTAHHAARRHRARAVATGFWQPTTDAEPIRAHLQRLRDAGLGLDRISRVSGIPGSTLRSLAYGKNGRRSQRVTQHTADRLLAVTATDTTRAARATIDAARTRTQLSELLASGLRWPDLANELGRSTANLRRTMHRNSVTLRTARDIARLHRRLLRPRAAPTRSTAAQPTVPCEPTTATPRRRAV